MAVQREALSEIVAKLLPIHFYRKHKVLAIRDILGVSLAPHARITVRAWNLQKSVNIALQSRGMGKSFILACNFLVDSILYPGLKCNVAAGLGFRQAKFVMLEIEKIINGSIPGQKQVGYAKACLADKARVISRDPSFWVINFKNGSSITAIPLGDLGEGVRGMRSHKLGLDEAYLMNTKLIDSVLSPMLNVLYDMDCPPDKQRVVNQSFETSTIDFSHRDFYRRYEHYRAVKESKQVAIINNKEIKPEDVTVVEFNIDDSYYTNSAKVRKVCWGLDISNIYKRLHLPTTDVDVWLAENKNKPMDLSGSYFSMDSIESCMDLLLDKKTDYYPDVLEHCAGPCVLAVDTAPQKANTAFIVIRAGLYSDQINENSFIKEHPKERLLSRYNSVVYAYEENKMSQKDRIKKIYELMGRYNLLSIVIDSRGGGYELADLMKDPDYVYSQIDQAEKPIYDPEIHICPNGRPILRLYTITQDLNFQMASYLKALITNQLFLIPRPVKGRDYTEDSFKIYGHVQTFINQLARIKAVESGKSVSFEIETVDPNSRRKVSANKDLFCVGMYANWRIKEFIDEKIKRDADNMGHNLPGPVGVSMHG